MDTPEVTCRPSPDSAFHRGRLAGVFLVVATAALCGAKASAQQAAPVPAPEESRTTEAHAREADGTAPATSVPKQRFKDEVVVTATRSERDAESLPVSVTVVDREEIEQSPSLQFESLLRNVAGVIIPNGNSATQFPVRNTVAMRGVGNGRTLVLLDGVPLNDPMFGHVDWNRIISDDVERIEVVRGATASLFGNAAMGGTISLVSRRVADDRVFADVAYGSFKTRKGAVTLDRRLGPGVAVGVAVDAASSDGYNRIPVERRGAVDIESPWESRNALARVDLDLAPGLHGFVRGGYYTSYVSQGVEDSWYERRTSDVAAGFAYGEKTTGEVALNLFYVDSQFDNQNAVTTSDGSQSWVGSYTRGPGTVEGGSIVWSRAFGERLPLLSAGIDLRRLTGDNYRQNYSRTGGLTSTQASGGVQESTGVFAEASWFPLTRLEVLLSTRYDDWQNRDGYDVISTGAENRFPDRGGDELSPRLAVRYDLGGGLAARGAVYRAFSSALLNELYRSTAFRNQELLPNPELTPETLRGAEIGLELAVPRVRVQVNAFENQIDDVISQVVLQLTPILRLQRQNLGTARSRGFELIADAYLGDRWYLAASYTYTDATTRTSPTSPDVVGKQLPEVPRNAASLGVTYRMPWGGIASARVRYVDTKYADAANLLPYDSHTLVDLYAAHPLTSQLEGYVGVTNLFNEEYLDDRTPTIRRGAPFEAHVGLRLRTGLPGPRAAAGGS